ncbi:UDP-glucosyltransferase 2 isoform X2 [Amyelois transitella]|nr:UDP-glucosyltransferase 2 isoform X2 [Amyelois transitella]
MVEKIDGHAPNMKVLYDSVDLMIVNEHKTWDFNRPVPLSMVYLYGTLIKPRSEISKDITAFIDSSPNGVIYLSFGTSVSECQLPQDKLQIMLKVFSELPYNVLWKWGDDLPGKPQNVLVRKWFDQANILKHPKIKLFITQGGVQSIEESIEAAVPMLGLPIVFDQLGNVDKMVRFGFGKKLDIFTMTEDEFRDAVNTLIDNKSYRQNVEKIRTLFLDLPQKPLERAVWCIETILRHGGRHLRSPAANLPWTEYYEVDLFLSILIVLLVLIVIVIMLVRRLQKFIYEVFRTDRVKSY